MSTCVQKVEQRQWCAWFVQQSASVYPQIYEPHLMLIRFKLKIFLFLYQNSSPRLFTSANQSSLCGSICCYFSARWHTQFTSTFTSFYFLTSLFSILLFLLSLRISPYTPSYSFHILLGPSALFMVPICSLFLLHPTPPSTNTILLHLLHSFPILSLYQMYALPVVIHIYCLQYVHMCESKSLPWLKYSLVYCHRKHKHLLFSLWFMLVLSLLTFCLHPFPREGRMAGQIYCGPKHHPAHKHSLLQDICIDAHSHVYVCTWLYDLREKHRHAQCKIKCNDDTMPALTFFKRMDLPHKDINMLMFNLGSGLHVSPC